MTSRRKVIGTIGLAGLGSLIQTVQVPSLNQTSSFRFCLNTATVSKNPLSVKEYIQIASSAGYDSIELWIRDLKSYKESGNSFGELKKYIAQKGLTVQNVIGFAPWMTGGGEGFRQMKEEMEMAALIGSKRIAAPAAGVDESKPLDLFMAGSKYRELIALGREIGVMPQLEFWGSFIPFSHIGQALMVAAVAGDPDVRILADVFHLFRGNSGFEPLKMLNGRIIEIFHMNDYPAGIPREKQEDPDRIFPGDGLAPFKQILTDLRNTGGQKILSLELFNESYWKEDPLAVAKKGLAKMKKLVDSI